MNARATLFMILSLTPNLYGYGSIRNAWVDNYNPGVNNESIGCQLCHVNSTGGSPWNAYGFAIRLGITVEGKTLIEAFTAVEGQNSDNSPEGSTNLEEIQADSAPGWTDGANNSTYSKTFTVTEDQLPPATTFSLDIPADPYDAWIAGFYPGETSQAIIGKTADPNGDGIKNLICFYLGTDPRETDSANMPTLTYSGANVIISHQRNALNASGLVAGLEYNTDLGTSWDKAVDGVNGVSVIISPADPLTGMDLIQYTIPAPVEGRLFSRVYVNE